MNLLHALTQLGYINAVDFKIDASDINSIAVWNHVDSIPDQATLDQAWIDWLAMYGPTLDDIKAEAKYQVDRMAERVRQQYITHGSAQAMTYQEKGDEAADYAAAGYPANLSTYPFLRAEVNATGKTAAQAADDILAQKSAWIAVGAAIEEIRIRGKVNIEAAVDKTEVTTLQDSTIAALEAI